jgi:[Skp1-protein]-hydroxyproline N-acetylglucosaminyltransferase
MDNNNVSIFIKTLTILIILEIISIIIISSILINKNFTEQFGVVCMDYIPYKETPEYEIKKGKIFISVASYRDPECSITINSIFNNAKNPENIFLGICEQNNKNNPEESCINNEFFNKYPQYFSQIRFHNMDFTEAKGPTYARYFCSKLWKGEEYYLQIDSHSFFEKNWDFNLINMLKECEKVSNRPILSTYPPTSEQIKNPSAISVIDSGSVKSNDIPVFLAGIWTYQKNDQKFETPLKATKPVVSGGLMFTKSSFLYDVPYDPSLSNLFNGEELLFSARLFTNGYDVFVPNINILSHHYNRNGPMYHKDVKNTSECRNLAEKKVLFLLGLLEKQSVADSFLRDYNKYGLGNFRSVSDFFNATGITIKNEKIISVENWGQNSIVSEKFNGWNFYKSGYEKIRKWN